MSLDVVGAVGAPSEIRQVELDLVPAAVEAHRQHAAERMHTSRALVVAGAEPTPYVLVVKYLHHATDVNNGGGGTGTCASSNLLWAMVPTNWPTSDHAVPGLEFFKTASEYTIICHFQTSF